MSTVTATSAMHFWAAVEDCLATFHAMQRTEAAEKVTSLWQHPAFALNGVNRDYEDMIYHAEPWQIACNLACNDLNVTGHQAAYQALLLRHELSAP
jgi:hypothetical protein